MNKKDIKFSFNFNDFAQKMKDLAAMTPKDEPWNSCAPERSFYLICRYISYYWEIILEQELMCVSGNLAAWFTGLLDERWNRIYCIARKSKGDSQPQPWEFLDWCVEGQGNGKLLARFGNLPQAASFYSSLSDLHYDTHLGAPSFDLMHAVDRIDRVPDKLLEMLKPTGCTYGPADKALYYDAIRENLAHNTLSMTLFKSAIENAVAMAFKRATADPFCAAASYNPRQHSICLLLPLSICNPNEVDGCLVVQRNQNGTYTGETILGLQDAFINARLIGRFSSSWLSSVARIPSK